jgi:signal transduction histidine kinase
MTRRPPWQLMVAAVLLVLLATLATLQYRWLGEVSDAERERMRVSLRTRATEFTSEFDGELTRTYVAFHVEGDRLDADPAATLADAWTRWQASASTPGLVSAIYLVEGRVNQPEQLRRYDVEQRALEPTGWPADLAASFTRARRVLPSIAGVPPATLMTDAVDSRTPALFVVIPRITRIVDGRHIGAITDPAALARIVIVVLDKDRLRDGVLEPLVSRYFGEGVSSDYLVTIVRRDEPAEIIYSSSGAPIDAAGADVATGLFDLRMDELNRLAGPFAIGRGHSPTTDRVAITIVRRADGSEGRRVLMAGGDDQGAWQLRVRHRRGSLDAIVTRSRRRNLGISLGVLGLLGASVVLIIAAAQRQQRLARQQMEFVAAVSHELRTPLAVICSAGENLADGVVADGSQVKKYGTLIHTEGRRLRDMVERVMDFAGVTPGSPARAHADVDLAAVIADAVVGVAAEARERGVVVTVNGTGSAATVSGDAGALRSAIQNIVGNAVKYSREGASVVVETGAVDGRVRVRVVDRGLGIDAGDLPHVFKPFYRGRRALDAQVRGAGIGLSVVRHVIDAHGGTVRVDSRPGEGTTVTVDLPLRAAGPAADRS